MKKRGKWVEIVAQYKKTFVIEVPEIEKNPTLYGVAVTTIEIEDQIKAIGYDVFEFSGRELKVGVACNQLKIAKQKSIYAPEDYAFIPLNLKDHDQTN